MKKTRLKFFGHLHRIYDNMLTKKILNLSPFLENHSNWLVEMKAKSNQSKEQRRNRSRRNKIQNRHEFAEQPKLDKTKWTEEGKGRRRRDKEISRRLQSVHYRV